MTELIDTQEYGCDNLKRLSQPFLLFKKEFDDSLFVMEMEVSI